jgi:hypothetical protein
MPLAKDRMNPRARAVTRQSRLSVKEQEIVKRRGVTLAPFADREPRFYGIVENSMTFCVDVESSEDEGRPKSGEFPPILVDYPPPRIRPAAAETLGDRSEFGQRQRCAQVTQTFTPEFDYAVY